MEFLLELLLENTMVQGAIATLLLGVIGTLAKKSMWAKHLMALGKWAHDRIEEHPDFKDFKGLEKLPPFVKIALDKFAEEHEGKKPNADDKALIIKGMEKAVEKAHAGK